MTSRESIGTSNSNSTRFDKRYFWGVQSAFLFSLYLELATFGFMYKEIRNVE